MDPVDVVGPPGWGGSPPPPPPTPPAQQQRGPSTKSARNNDHDDGVAEGGGGGGEAPNTFEREWRQARQQRRATGVSAAGVSGDDPGGKRQRRQTGVGRSGSIFARDDRDGLDREESAYDKAKRKVFSKLNPGRVVRGMVSKKKRRFQEDGFDLDLSYITDKVIAMGFPSTGVEGVYRNPMPEVQRFFNTRHPGHNKIYNLCSEKAYDLEDFFDLVERFPFDDHNPCALQVIERFCGSVQQYLAEDDDNVVGVHCKAGKGRTGLMICCFLLHSGECRTAQEALANFAAKRTHNNKGVTIPSQIRYVYYYEQMLRRAEVTTFTYQITHVRLITVPNFDPSITGGGCDPYVKVKVLNQIGMVEWEPKTVFNQLKEGKEIRKHRPSEPLADIDLTSSACYVRGDVQLMLFDRDQYSADDKMGHIWFNTSFVERNYLSFEKSVIDKACKDKKCHTFNRDFRVLVFLHRVEDAKFNDAHFDDGQQSSDENSSGDDADDGFDQDP